ncbi:hypothetical protein [Fodinibius sediminis]|uniref:Uncharacterized protein n=1 Tax=Fodinibius sediminis TaxID=1214077 RepID=A0A521FDV6_9BACT|nr:hypothetical protein [Fodinibius sediminis]SMO94355.1 hypothetical protein SAMN06265218_1316 [Fodinibius sediminis]
MGQKRIHNIIDEKFGTHLAEFQKKLTNSMEEAYFERIDELNRRTEELNNRADAFANALDRGEELTKKNRQFVEKYEMKMTLNYMLAGALGGAIGGLIVLLLWSWLG